MPGLSGSAHAIKSARAGVARSGASRAGWPILQGIVARQYALSAIARSGATRSNYTSGKVFVAIAGVGVTYGFGAGNRIRVDSLSITDTLNDAATTATLRTWGIVPAAGADVVATLGSKNNMRRLFGGTVLNLKQGYLGSVPAHVFADVNLIDYTWGLGRRKVTARYLATTAGAVLTALVGTFATSYTAAASADFTGLPIDEITFTDQDLSDCLTQLTKRVGGSWLCDYFRVVRAFLVDTTQTAPTIINAVHRTLSALTIERDLGSVVTRVLVEGGGGNTLEACAPGETIIPVDVATWYEPTGGTVRSGPNRLTYTARALGGGGSLVGPGAGPVAAPGVTLASGAGVDNGSHDYAVTYTTPAGLSVAGPRATIAVGNLAAPVSPPTTAPATIGVGPDAGSHDYAVTFVTSSGETTAGPSVTQATGITVAPTVAPVPSAPTMGAGPDPGTHDYAVTFVTPIGETTPGPVSAQVTTGPIAAPSTAPTAGAAVLGLGPAAGSHDYAVTFVTSSGETTAGPRTTTSTGLLPAPATAPTAAGVTVGSGPDAGSHNYAVTYVAASGETTPGPIVTLATDVTPAPTGAPVPGTPTAGAGADDGTHDYALSFTTSVGETTPGPIGVTVTTGPVAGVTTAAPGSAPAGAAAGPTGNLSALAAYKYAVTFIAGAGETTASPLLTMFVASISNGGVAPGYTAVAGSGLGVGFYEYAFTLISASGETAVLASTSRNTTSGNQKVHITAPGTGADPRVTGYRIYRGAVGAGSPLYLVATQANGVAFDDTTPDATLVTRSIAPTVDTASTGQFALSSIPVGAALVTARKIYRTTANGSQLKLLATLGDNTTTTYTDNIADASLGVNVPTVNTTATSSPCNQVPLTVPTSADPSVTGRRIYRRSGGAGLRLLVSIGNNSATSYLDTVANASLGAAPLGATTALLNRIALAAIPLGPAGVTARKIYRSPADGGTLLLAGTLANNSSTSFTDTTTDAGLGVAAPGVNTAVTNQIPLSAIPVGPAGVTGRNIYRTAAGASQLQLLATISNNSATTYVDQTPDAPTVAPGTRVTAALAGFGAGNVNTGTHAWLATFVTAGGETDAGPGQALVIADQTVNGQVAIGAVPISPAPEVTGRNLYRTVSGGSVYMKLGALGNNTASTFLDSVADSSLGVVAPAVNTTGLGPNVPTVNTAVLCQVPITSIPRGDATVTGRRIYRRSAGVGLRLVGTIADNTTTSFLDTVINASLGVAVPITSTAYLQQIALTAIPLGAALVTARKIYRTTANGSQLKLLATLGDNTTTAFLDTVTDASLGATAPVTNTATANQVALLGLPIGAAAVTSRTIWRTVAGGTQLRFLATIADNVTTTYTDVIADASLGANVQVSDTSGLAQPAGNVLAGSTTLIMAGLGGMPSTGWAVIGNGQQVIRYTGIVGSSLTGIPSSGVGSITATVSYNSTVTAAPQLTGIPVTGPGSIVFGLLRGDAVNLRVQVDDVVAQGALAALIGGDGVQESTLQDGRLARVEALSRGTAQLALTKAILVTVTYQSRDMNTRAGATVSTNIGAPTNLFGDFLIQQVTIDKFNARVPPTYTVTAASTRFSFDDLLRLVGDSLS
jgi:hypothetical protein